MTSWLCDIVWLHNYRWTLWTISSNPHWIRNTFVCLNSAQSAWKHSYANGNAESFTHNNKNGKESEWSQGLTEGFKGALQRTKKKEKRKKRNCKGAVLAVILRSMCLGCNRWWIWHHGQMRTYSGLMAERPSAAMETHTGKSMDVIWEVGGALDIQSSCLP